MSLGQSVDWRVVSKQVNSEATGLPEPMRALALHWSFHRPGGMPPHVNALAAVDLLPWWSNLVFVSAILSRPRWDVLAAGGFAIDMFGRSFVGSDFLDVDGRGTRASTLERMARVIRLGAPVVYVGQHSAGPEGRQLETHRIALPLRSELDEVRHIMLGVFPYLAPPVPRRSGKSEPQLFSDTNGDRSGC
jgi:hypothetical protein